LKYTKLLPILVLSGIVLVVTVISGCTSPNNNAAQTSGAPTNAAQAGEIVTSSPGQSETLSPNSTVLTINGSVNNPQQLTFADLEAYPTIPVHMEIRGNWTAISLNSVLDNASPTSNATNVTFVGGQGNEITIPLSELNAYNDSAIIIVNQRMLVGYFPESPGNSVASLSNIIVS